MQTLPEHWPWISRWEEGRKGEPHCGVRVCVCVCVQHVCVSVCMYVNSDGRGGQERARHMGWCDVMGWVLSWSEYTWDGWRGSIQRPVHACIIICNLSQPIRNWGDLRPRFHLLILCFTSYSMHGLTDRQIKEHTRYQAHVSVGTHTHLTSSTTKITHAHACIVRSVSADISPPSHHAYYTCYQRVWFVKK